MSAAGVEDELPLLDTLALTGRAQLSWASYVPRVASLPEGAEHQVLARLLETRRTEATRRTYGAAVREFFTWCEQQGESPLTESPLPPLRFLDSLRQRGLAESTVFSRTVALRQFFQLAHLEGLIARSPMVNVRPPDTIRQRYARPDTLNQLELAGVLAAAEQSPRTDDGAIVGLLALCGLRPTQVSNCRVSDLRYEDQRVYLHVASRRTDARVELAPYNVRTITRHLDGRTSGLLILNQWQRKLNRENIGRALDRSTSAAGVRDIVPNVLRASMVDVALTAGASLHSLADVLGASDIRYIARFPRNTSSEAVAPRLDRWLFGSAEENLLDDAERLLGDGYHPSFVIGAAAAVVESMMRAVASRFVDEVPEDPNIEWYKKTLNSQTMLTRQLDRDLAGRFETRNTAAHGRGFETLTVSDAEQFIGWARVLVRHLETTEPKPRRRRRRP